MSEGQVTKSTVENISLKKRGRPQGITFPRDSLKRALRLANAIEKDNAGQPFDRLDLAKSVSYSPNASGFRTLIISSGRYGLTIGGYSADKIELTPLGSAIVAPTADEDPNAKMREALITPKIFKEVFEKFNKKNIPREEIFKSTLKKEFGISQDVDACYKIIMQNIEELGISQDFKGSKFLNLEKLGEPMQITNIEEATAVEESEILQTSEQEIIAETTQPKEKTIPKVFISHSKNENIIEQLKTILEFGDFQSTIAEEVETASIPIPDKIFGLMRECNCAIINVVLMKK